MNENNRAPRRRQEVATYSRERIEASVDDLVELRRAEKYEALAYRLDALPADLKTPSILSLVHRLNAASQR